MPYNNPYYNVPQYNQQQTGFISVRNIEEARNYPVAPGNSITFKDETAPYVYTKTMGFSQLERPTFERYKLVKEDDVIQEMSQYASKQEISGLSGEIEQIKDKIRELEDRLKETEEGV